LTLRVSMHYTISPTTDASVIDAIAKGPKRAGARWRAGGVKFFMDGVIETGTAWLEEPDTHGDGNDPMWPDIARYRQLVRTFHDEDFQVATHAIGDRAVREVLDTYRGLPGGHGRHRVEHIETVPDQTIARFLPEGVAASMQPMHLRWMKPDLSDPWSERLGAHRCEHTMRSGDLSAAGALMVLGSDWPVASYDPRLGFYTAQLRRAPDLPDKGAIGTSRPLTGEETLAGYTTNAAKANGESDLAGMLRPGCRADFVAWAEDPAECPARDVAELPVLATVVAGAVVHQAA
ncbi:MAG: amidohydrolase family protein, partial [Acidimicrobiaceae bacterium]|nr:amidohydrolase family protein [Acidimicrobiaceae bacterium]